MKDNHVRVIYSPVEHNQGVVKMLCTILKATTITLFRIESESMFNLVIGDRDYHFLKSLVD